MIAADPKRSDFIEGQDDEFRRTLKILHPDRVFEIRVPEVRAYKDAADDT